MQSERGRFEWWISAAPYERLVDRFPDGDVAWPGQYRDIAVELAWDAWQTASARAPAPDAAAALEGDGIRVKRVRIGSQVFVPECTPAPDAAAALALVEAMAWRRDHKNWPAKQRHGPLTCEEDSALDAALSASAPAPVPTLRERLGRKVGHYDEHDPVLTPGDAMAAVLAHLRATGHGEVADEIEMES